MENRCIQSVNNLYVKIQKNVLNKLFIVTLVVIFVFKIKNDIDIYFQSLMA